MRGFFRKKRSDPPEPLDAAAGLVREGRRRSILIVDDSPTATHILFNTLIKAGFMVETAANGEEGVDMAVRLHPDVILMDVVMPKLNGFQATRQLRRDPSTADIPVIIITNKNQETDRTWGLRQGAVDYLVKPVDPGKLLERIKAAVGD
jgi:twitching motility two-component system response regulator PilH